MSSRGDDKTRQSHRPVSRTAALAVAVAPGGHNLLAPPVFYSALTVVIIQRLLDNRPTFRHIGRGLIGTAVRAARVRQPFQTAVV